MAPIELYAEKDSSFTFKTASLSFDKRNQKQGTERKLNLSMINANKYMFLSTREVMMAVYSPSYLFFFSPFCGSRRSIKNAKEAYIQPS